MSDGDYAAAIAGLARRRRFGLRPGLEVVRALLGALGDPQATFRAIHVTGSKGKGSVAAMAAAILTATGRRTGLYTSPHLQSFRERIQIDRTPITRAQVVEGLARVEAASGALLRAGAIDREPTFFEATTALAFDRFRSAGIEDAVVEVGIGGRLDATNVLDARAMVVTTIELEHTELLGTTFAAIAREKSGIFHPGGHAVVGRLPPEARKEVDHAAAQAGIPIWHLDEQLAVVDRAIDDGQQTISVALPGREIERIRLPLLGTFQPTNAALAIGAVDRYLADQEEALPDAAVRKGLAHVAWRGRLEQVARRPDVFVDVAHTPESALALAASLGEIAPFAPPDGNVVLFGCLAEKKAAAMLEALSPLAHTVVLVPVPSERSADVQELRRLAAGRFRRIVVAPAVPAGLTAARAATDPDGYLVAAGSDYLAGAVLDALEGRDRDEPDLSDPGVERRAPPEASR